MNQHYWKTPSLTLLKENLQRHELQAGDLNYLNEEPRNSTQAGA